MTIATTVIRLATGVVFATVIAAGEIQRLLDSCF